ncbi:MAG TPA: patatin-like phospholipase family protein, partial [Rubrobacter sp.]|nr:patatin-like phospholipase family protein [Rubrobacter sp.]
KGVEGHDYEIVALSGTSGGSICALLAWYGLLMDDTNKAVELLDSFWQENSAKSLQDRILNDWLLQANRFFGNLGGTPTISPYLTPASSWASDQLRSMLERHVDFGKIEELVKPSSPMLLIGAADVVSGKFKAFSSKRDRINVEMVLASAALPTLFKAVHTNGGVYWDGLFSQNPPVRELPHAKPDEIWVIQIDPQRRAGEPTTMPDIMDRRNELAGNLSLYQEIYFIEKINKWVTKGDLSGTKHRVIDVKWIKLLWDLDSESKLNRDPRFIQELMAYGEDRAEAFLNRERTEVGGTTG